MQKKEEIIENFKTALKSTVKSISNKEDLEINFGNPPSAPSSIESDANGFGSFEYAPPSGYLALCTKNLGSNG